MTIPQPSKPRGRRDSHAAQGGSISKNWNIEELRLYGAIDTTIPRPQNLSGEIHPVFANWSVDTDPRLRRELEQPLLLASKLLDGTGLHWISDFIIEDIFSEKYPGRYAKVTTTKGLTLDTSTAGLSQGATTPDITPPLSPSPHNAYSSIPSSSYTSPRSSSSSPTSVYSELTSPSSSPVQLKDFPFPYPSSFLQTNTATSGKPSQPDHGNTVNTSALFGRSSVYINTTAPETVFRHRRAPWWTRGAETKWLHRADRWLRRELGPALIWQLESRSTAGCDDDEQQCSRTCGVSKGGDMTHSDHSERPPSQRGDFEVVIPKELVERLATLRLAEDTDSEEYLLTAFMAAVAMLHELGHAVFWRGCHPHAFLKNSELSREPFYGADLEMELGDSFVSSIFGGWVPVPVTIPEIDVSSTMRCTRGLAWRQALTWDKHRIRPKYRAHYSIPIDHIALLFSQASWDCCDVRPETLIYPLALVQDKTASFTNTVGLITNAAVLKREHATAALPDFVKQSSGDGWMWNQNRKGTSFRIMQFGGIVCLDLDLPVAKEGVVREALPNEPASSGTMRMTAAREKFADAINGAGNAVGLDSPTLPTHSPSLSKKPKKQNTTRRISRTTSPTKLRPLSVKDKNALLNKTTSTNTSIPGPETSQPDVAIAGKPPLIPSSSTNKLPDNTDERISAITRKLKSLNANHNKQLPPLPPDAVAAATRSSKRITLHIPPQPTSTLSPLSASSSSSSSSSIPTPQSSARSSQYLTSGIISPSSSAQIPTRSMALAGSGIPLSSSSRRQFKHAKSFSTSTTGIRKPIPLFQPSPPATATIAATNSLSSTTEAAAAAAAAAATVAAMISAATSLQTPTTTTKPPTQNLLTRVASISTPKAETSDPIKPQGAGSGRTRSMISPSHSPLALNPLQHDKDQQQQQHQKESPRHNSFTSFGTYHHHHHHHQPRTMDKELTYEELDSRLQNMIDTSITELEWLYF